MAPYRGPSENPDVARAVQALRQARTLLETFTGRSEQRHGEILANLVVLGRGRENESHLAIIDQAHAALWSSLNEAQDRLTRAGYDLGPWGTVRWTGKHDTASPARCLKALEALLPTTDFRIPLDDEAAAYVAAHVRRRRLWRTIGYVLCFLLPVAMFVTPLVCR